MQMEVLYYLLYFRVAPPAASLIANDEIDDLCVIYLYATHAYTCPHNGDDANIYYIQKRMLIDTCLSCFYTCSNWRTIFSTQLCRAYS